MKIVPKAGLDAGYARKDMLKAEIANKYIGRGSTNSSSEFYRKQLGQLANCGEYKEEDVVFISAEGNRTGRIPADANEILLAADANVDFVTDTPYHRNRAYNIGEREVAALLESIGYEETITSYYSLWRK